MVNMTGQNSDNHYPIKQCKNDQSAINQSAINQYAINIDEVTGLEQLRPFEQYISKERREKIARFYFEKDKIRSMLAEILLKYFLVTGYGMKMSDIAFGYEEYGKPYLLTGGENLYFNLSHSGSWVVCGIGTSRIGIDVEEGIKDTISIVKRVLSQNEYAEWKLLPQEVQKDKFYQIWTLKESYVKYIGKGLGIPFESLSFRINGKDVSLEVKGEMENSCSFFTNTLEAGYRVALCVNKNKEAEVAKEIQVVKLDMLLVHCTIDI